MHRLGRRLGDRLRGRGLAKTVLRELESTAVARGYRALVLETGLRQPEALALYESHGYTTIPNFGFYKESPLSVCYRKALEHEVALRQDAPMIYNTEIFEVSDVDRFKRAMERLRGALAEAGGTDLRLYRCIDDPTKVLAAMYWPDAESCRAFARDRAAEVESTLRPALTSHQPEDLWEEI